MIHRILEKLTQYTHTNDSMRQENNKRIQEFNRILQKNNFKTIRSDVIRDIATKRLFECYTVKEIADILDYFKILQEAEK